MRNPSSTTVAKAPFTLMRCVQGFVKMNGGYAAVVLVELPPHEIKHVWP